MYENDVIQPKESKQTIVHHKTYCIKKGLHAKNAYKPPYQKIIFCYQPSIHAKTKGATIVASLSIINLGVWMSNFPHVIFSLGTAPE